MMSLNARRELPRAVLKRYQGANKRDKSQILNEFVEATGHERKYAVTLLNLRADKIEIDLVTHCGDSAAGEFVHTLTMTDAETDWTECVGIVNRSKICVVAAIDAVRA